MRSRFLTMLTAGAAYCIALFLSLQAHANGNGSLAVTYDNTKCGLNYTTASQRLGKRFSPAGVNQPAAFVISGIPNCAVIEKAFLYVEGSGNGAAQTATITGPNGTLSFAMSLIGMTGDKCWGYSGSTTYRADVTSAISGNATYNISGIMTNPPNSGNDMDGATLIVIYTDPTVLAQGRVIIADGALERSGGSASITINYPAVCGATQNASAFCGIGDLQFNSSYITLNGTNYGSYNYNWWNYFQVNTSVSAGQTSSTYTWSDPSDCINYGFVGLYYQTTSCAVCTGPTINLSMANTPSLCGNCNGTATVTATANAGPQVFTYSWAPSGGNNATATGLCPGTYTVTVSNSCATATATVTINSTGGVTLAGTQTNVSCYNGCNGSATVTPSGGTPPYTYQWLPSGGNNATASNLCAGSYSCMVTDFYGCHGNMTFNITQPVQITASLSAGNTQVCAGQGTTMNFTGTPNATVTYNNGGPNQTITLNAAGTASVNTGPLNATTTYTLVSVQLAPCTVNLNTAVTITVNPLPVFNPGMPSNNSPICSGTALYLYASTTPASASYSWTGPAFLTPNLNQNPVVNAAQLGDAGTYTVTASTAAGCSATATTSVIIKPSPVVNTLNVTNPTGCGGNQGTITINGLTPSTGYDLYYSNPTLTVLSIVSDASGQYTLANLTAGTYSNIYVILNGCVSNAVGPVTLVDPAPPVIATAASTPPTYCGGNQGYISLIGLMANTTYTVTYFDGNSYHSITVATDAYGVLTINNLPAGIYSNITVILNNCSSAPVGPVTITDPAPPVISGVISAPPYTCNGNQGSISLNGLLPNTLYLVSYFDGFTIHTLNIFSDASGSVVIPNLSAGTYSNITVTLNSCTSAPVGPVTLSDPATPVITISSNSPVCEGQTLNFTASVMVNNVPVVPNDVIWTGPAFINPNNQQNPSVVNVIPSYAGVYTATATYANCTSQPATASVTVYPAPLPPFISVNSPICSGNDIHLHSDTAANVTDYYWTGPAGYSAHAQSPTILNGQAVNAGNYTLQVTSVNGCNLPAPQTVNVVVNQTPASPIPINRVYCQYEAPQPLTAQPTGNPNNTLKWYTTATGGLGTNTAPLPATTAPGVYVWYVSQVTAAGCEGPRVPDSVYVKAKPAPPVDVTPKTDYCRADAAVQLAALGDSLKWYDMPQGGTPAMAAPTPNTGSPGTFTWYVSQTVNGCESDRLPIIVHVGTPPPPPVTSNVRYCQNDPVAPLVVSGQNLRWYNLPQGGVPMASEPVPATGQPATYTWYATQTINGCESGRMPISVVVSYKPDASIYHTRDSICQDDTIAFWYEGNAKATAAYQWTMPPGVHVLSGHDAGPLVAHFPGAGNHVISLIVSDSGCTSPPAYDTVNIRQTPQISLDFRNNIVCVGDPAYINIDRVDMEIKQYLWDFGGGVTDDSSIQETSKGPYYVHYNEPGTYTVKLHVAAKDDCAADTSATVVVHDRPEAKIIAGMQEHVCSGEDILLSSGAVNNRYTYRWEPRQLFTNSFEEPQVHAHVDTDMHVTLTVTNEYGCQAMDSTLLAALPCCDFYLPTAFTPNGDGKNDVYRILNPGKHNMVSFMIFNRFGQMVFETANEYNGWNGTLEEVPQEMGTYFYLVKYHCHGKVQYLKGDLTLVR
ncbi:MAG: gliding motility-associated C-terminal domain-containing protein [Bacteroidetes bacterium]|nr:gliding motility-associated C-terminal domain-containing protein [Bacteroidota bacterium]